MKECCVACARAYCTRADIQPTAAQHVCPPPATTAFLQPPFCINSLTCGVYDRSAAEGDTPTGSCGGNQRVVVKEVVKEGVQQQKTLGEEAS